MHYNDLANLIIILIVVHTVVVGGLCAHLGRKKSLGGDGGAWFFAGMFFSVLGLIAAAGLPDEHTAEQNRLLKKQNKLLKEISEKLGAQDNEPEMETGSEDWNE